MIPASGNANREKAVRRQVTAASGAGVGVEAPFGSDAFTGKNGDALYYRRMSRVCVQILESRLLEFAGLAHEP